MIVLLSYEDWSRKLLCLNNMKYKIVKDVKIMGCGEGETIETEPHAVVVHLEKGEVIEVKAPPKKKIVKKEVKK